MVRGYKDDIDSAQYRELIAPMRCECGYQPFAERKLTTRLALRLSSRLAFTATQYERSPESILYPLIFSKYSILYFTQLCNDTNGW